MKTISAFTFAAAILVGTTAAQAASVDYATGGTFSREFSASLLDTTPDGTPDEFNDSDTFTLTAFDTNLGTLLNVGIEVFSNYYFDMTYDVSNGASGNYNAAMTTTIGGQSVGGFAENAGGFSCSIVEGCTGANNSGHVGASTVTYFTATEWAALASDQLLWAFNASVNLNGAPGTLSADTYTVMSLIPEPAEDRFWAAQVIYEYEVASAAVPLPAAGWMLLAGLGGVAALRRRRT